MTDLPARPKDSLHATIPRTLVHACCEEVGLDPDRDADEVIEAIGDPPDRDCCDSGCDPCVLTIVRAASLVKQRIGVPRR